METVGPRYLSASLLLAGAVFTLGCGSAFTPPDPDDPLMPADGVALREVVSGLGLPVHLTAPSSDPRLFIVVKGGTIRVVENGQLRATPFLDVSQQVSGGGEQGLLSLAFHPDYPTTGYFYIYYTDTDGDTRVVRYSVSGDRNRAAPNSATEILTVAQPFGNHNGGLLMFGPDDKLYVGLGDGGSGGDPQNHGQNRETLLGAILRIDVDAGDPYAIPSDNPFVGDGAARAEIWAYGLRNPWRYSFDWVADMLYIADVGQNSWEEVNAVPGNQSGLNFGWRVMEGTSCFNPSDCSEAGLQLPVLEYPTGSEGCAVVGGFVYRGTAISGLQGTYFYSDNCSGWIRSFRLVSGQVTESKQWDLGSLRAVLSFGEDGAGELYVLTASGRVFQFVPAP